MNGNVFHHFSCIFFLSREETKEKLSLAKSFSISFEEEEKSIIRARQREIMQPQNAQPRVELCNSFPSSSGEVINLDQTRGGGVLKRTKPFRGHPLRDEKRPI